MSEAHAERAKEEARLALVLAEIKRQLAEVGKLVAASKQTLLAERKVMWQDVPHLARTFEDAVNMSQHALLVGEKERDHALYRRIQAKLERLYYSPYFGRIDFAEEGQPAQQIYIGISSLLEPRTGAHLVYDWRAPVSSMFYDAELGPAAYVCEDGLVEGRLLLKRQYNIAEGKLLYFFDTSLKIDDDVLQEVLAKHADDKMRTIVTSIQREQNRIIRDEEHPVLIVQGPAGSGKTSIALHRAAYLLYRFRGKLSSENLVIFSPNRIFSDYISNVLPELGEESIQQLTFTEYAQAQLGPNLRVEPMEEQMEYLLTRRDAPEYGDRVQGIRFKASEAFLRILDAYVRYLEQGEALTLEDVRFNGYVIMDRAEMLQRLRERYADAPYARRLAMLYRRIQFLLEEPLKETISRVAEQLANDPDAVGLTAQDIRRQSRKIVNLELRRTLAALEPLKSVDAAALYRALFADRDLFYRMAEGVALPERIEAVRLATVQALEAQRVPYEDVAPLMYLKLRVEGAPAGRDIRHVIVDEAQDYTIFHYHAMRLSFPGSSFTILGDVNQAVNPYMGISDYDGVVRVFADRGAHLIGLKRSYRSTLQIAEFTRALLPAAEPVEPIRREGPRPRLILVDEAQRFETISREAERLRQEGARSIALICKTAAMSRQVYEALRPKLRVVLLQQGDTVFRTGLVVLPVYLAKGLEFDAVVVCDAEAATYGGETDRRTLYTACTRALHRLSLVCAGAPSPLLPPEEAGLFERVE